MFLGVTLLGISVVPVLVSQLLFCVTVLEIATTAVVPCRESPPDDLLGGAVLGLVVGPVVFLFTHLAELAAGAIRTSAGTAWSHFWSLSARTVGNLLY